MQTETEGDKQVSLTIERTGLTSQPVTVRYRIEEVRSTAAAGTDYQALDPEGAITFGVDESSKDISIQLIDNDLYQPADRILVVKLEPDNSNNPDNASIIFDEAFLTIKDNDPPPTPPVLSSDRQITGFELLADNAGVSATITHNGDDEDGLIEITVPSGTNLVNITPESITIPEGAALQPDAGQPRDFSNPVVYTVAAEDGTKKRYVVTVEVETQVVSAEALLAEMIVKIGEEIRELTPLFTPDTLRGYELAVDSGVDELTLEPALPADSGAIIVIKVNNQVFNIDPGDPAVIPLREGTNVIEIEVTAEDGVTKNNYVITATRGSGTLLGGNVDLRSITLSSGALSPGFDPQVQQYYVDVPYATGSMNLLAETADPDSGAVIMVNNSYAALGSTFNLKVGANGVTIIVTSLNGNKKEYYISIGRAKG